MFYAVSGILLVMVIGIVGFHQIEETLQSKLKRAQALEVDIWMAPSRGLN